MVISKGKYYLFAAVVWLFSNCLHSQEFYFKKYDVEHGLLSNEVYDIIQAKDKSLWAATFKGVFQFDGQKFKNYTKDEGLNSNLPRTVFEDSKGGIWVGFWQDGLNYIKNGKVIKFNEPLLDSFHRTIQFYEAKDGTIFIFNSFSILSYKEGTFTLLHERSGEDDYAYPNDVIQTSDGIIWIATLGRGLFKMTTEPFQLEKINNKTHGINNIAYSVYVNNEKNLLIGSYGIVYEYSDGEFNELQLEGDNDRNRVWSITQDEDENYWLGLYGNGIRVMDKNFNFLYDINDTNGLPDNYLHKVLIDSENNKWIASLNNGLIRFRDKSFSFYSKKEGLPSNIINDVLQVGDTAFIASDKGVFTFKNGKVLEEYVKNRFIYRLDKDKFSNVWNVNDFGYGNVKAKMYENEEDTYYTLSINEQNDKLMAGAYYARLVNDSIQKTYRFHNLQARISQTLGDVFLIGNNRGVFEFSKDTLVMIPNLPADFRAIQTSAKLTNNEVFFANNDYLVYIKKEAEGYINKAFPKRYFTGLQGFNAIKVSQGKLWVASSNVLAQIDIENLIVNDSVVMKTYTHELGFVKAEPLDNALEVFDNGDVYIGTSEGLQIFSPTLFKDNTIPPTLKINSIYLFSEPIIDSLFLTAEGYEFSYKQNHITFNLSAITHTYPENVNFKYRLNGLPNAVWSKPSKDSRVAFPFLPPGDYEFEFVADNGFGVWQETPEKISIVISTPFWKTQAFMFAVIALMSFLTIGFVIWDAKIKQRRNKKYTQGLLKAQEDERKRISKELHDGIGQDLLLIKNSLTIDASKTTILVDKTIEEIRGLSRNLHPAELDKFGLSKALKSQIEQVNEVSEIYFSENIEDIDSFISKEKSIYIYRIVQECINNILKHSKASAARIEVNAAERIIIKIQDNGKGFDVPKRKLKSKSLGLQSLFERVSYLNGTLDINSKLGKGTKITISIPWERTKT